MAGENMALEAIHDAFIIDLGLPDLDGLDLIARCRAQGQLRTSFNSVARRVCRRNVFSRTGAGRRATTDETPFALPELLARLRNLLRRSCDSTDLNRCACRLLTYSSILVRREARRGDHLLQLTRRNFLCWNIFVAMKAGLVTRTMILDHVWKMKKLIPLPQRSGCPYLPPSRAKWIMATPRPLIHTIRGVGYVLNMPRSLRTTAAWRISTWDNSRVWPRNSRGVYDSLFFSSRGVSGNGVTPGLAAKLRFWLRSRRILQATTYTSGSCARWLSSRSQEVPDGAQCPRRETEFRFLPGHKTPNNMEGPLWGGPGLGRMLSSKAIQHRQGWLRDPPRSITVEG